MSYKYLTRPEPKDGSFGFTFPGLEAELSPATVKSAKIKPALNRIAKQLMKQYATYRTRMGNEKVVGIDFHNIGFTLVLGKSEDSK